MKKKIAFLLTLAVTLLAFTSCDEDSLNAYFFEGYWEGQMGSYFYDELGYGTDYYYSQLDISQTDAYGGRGQERDYNGYGGSYSVMNFTWEAKNGYIYFYYDNGAQVVLDFTAEGGGNQMSARVYDAVTLRPVGVATLYRINTWDNTWYNNPRWAKPNAIENKEE